MGKIISFILAIILSLNQVNIILADGDIISSYNHDSFNNYYMWFYLNDEAHDYVDLYSLNNLDETAYWRPKYSEVSKPIEEYIEFTEKKLNIRTNAFDVDWSEINKENLPKSRPLELLGYDYLLFKETINKDTGEPERTMGYNYPITAPYFIMNIYKALGMELYDIYFIFEKGTGNVGTYVTRTNPESYWKLFLNDHPIDYDVYNDYDVSSIESGEVLTNADAICILSQMLDRYGEPVISNKEEYMLLQVYGDDVPENLGDKYKEAWSYLKCRGIIGEEEYNYNSELTFDVMMELLMRAADESSRTNFKEVQITTDLDDAFIDSGYYQVPVTIENKVPIEPDSFSIDFSGANRIDYLIEINNDIAFRYQDTGELNRNIFISYEPNYDSEPVPGSIFEGIVDNRYYHFSIPVSEVKIGSYLYLNSNKGNDYPLNYKLTSSSGGVYSLYSYDPSSGYVTFSIPSTFNSTFKDSLYVDFNRLDSGKVSAASGIKYTANYYDYGLLDIDKTKENIIKNGGTFTPIGSTGFTVTIDPNKLQYSSSTSFNNFVNNLFIYKEEFTYKTTALNDAILGLTGEKLLIDIEDAKNSKLIANYKYLTEEDTLLIYTFTNDIIIVNNKDKTIQKGNTYFKINENQDLVVYKDNSYKVDFRGLFGTKEIAFSITENNGTCVTFYDNRISSYVYANNVLKEDSIIQKVGSYTWETAYFTQAYNNTNQVDNDIKIDILVDYENNGYNTSKILLPMSSYNMFGNYIIYGEMDYNKSEEVYYLVRFIPNKISTGYSKKEKELSDLFKYLPEYDLKDYSIDIIKLTANNNIGFEYIDGVGWCYNLITTINNNERLAFFNTYRTNVENTYSLPFTVNMSTPRTIYNYNINYLDDNSLTTLNEPTDANYNGFQLAPIGVQSWFSKSSYISTLSKDYFENKNSSSTSPLVYFGNMKVKYSSSGKLVTEIGNFDLTTNLKDSLNFRGVLKFRGTNYSEDIYLNPGIYSATTNNFNTTLNTNVENNNTLNKKEIGIEDFFNKFDDIKFLDLIKNLDGSISILYYILIQVVPMVIFTLLILILLISLVSDIKLVILFCDRVIDPIKVITFGHYDIHTVRNRNFIFSLIAALTVMGFIQLGNLEKIILFLVKTFYAIYDMFKF